MKNQPLDLSNNEDYRWQLQIGALKIICCAIAGYAAWHFIPKILATL